MPRNGSGTFDLEGGVNPVVPGTIITTEWANPTLQDVADEITNSIPRDGQAPPTADISWGGYRLTNLGSAIARTDAMNLGQVADGGFQFLHSVTGSDAITGVATPAPASYVAGQVFYFVAADNNQTSGVTLNVNALGPKNIGLSGGTVPPGYIVAGNPYQVLYDGSQFQLLSGAPGTRAIQIAERKTTRFVSDGSTYLYTLPFAPNSVDDVVCIFGGVWQTPGVDFTLAGFVITLTTPAPATVPIVFNYQIGTAGYADAAAIRFMATLPGTTAMTVEAALMRFVHVDFWNGDLKAALSNAPPYTTIFLGNATYDITGLYKTTTGDGVWLGNTTPGIRLMGAGKPRLSDNGRYLTGGTVIQGTLFNLANDFAVYDLGVDVGTDVVANLYGGHYHECFVPGCNITYPTPAATIKNVCTDRVITLAAVPDPNVFATFVHSSLFENLEHVRIGQHEAIGGYHGFVSKCIDMQADTIIARGTIADSAIFKADPANANHNVSIGKLIVDSYKIDGVEIKVGPIQFENIGNAVANSFISIGQLIVRNQQSSGDVIMVTGTFPITDVTFGSIIADKGTDLGCLARLGFNGSVIQRWSFGNWDLIAGRSIELSSTVVGIDVGSGNMTVIQDTTLPLIVLDGDWNVGDIKFDVTVPQSASKMVQRNSGAIIAERFTFSGSNAPGADRIFSSRQTAFTINGTNFAALAPAGYAGVQAIYAPYRLQFQGAVKALVAGAAKVIGTVNPGPLSSKRFTIEAQNSALTLLTYQVEINTSGVVTCLSTIAVDDYLFLDSINLDLLT